MSDDRTEEIKKNILSPNQWVRILYMVFYAVACWALLFVLPVIILCQVIISLISGADNRNLRDFGAVLSDFFHQAMNYLLYVSDDKPWPFSDGEDFGDTFATDTGADNDEDDFSTETPVTEAEVAPDVEQHVDEVGEQAPARDDASKQQARDDVFSDISFTGDADADDDKKDPA